jgi:hypothetical protein
MVAPPQLAGRFSPALGADSRPLPKQKGELRKLLASCPSEPKVLVGKNLRDATFDHPQAVMIGPWISQILPFSFPIHHSWAAPPPTCPASAEFPAIDVEMTDVSRTTLATVCKCTPTYLRHPDDNPIHLVKHLIQIASPIFCPPEADAFSLCSIDLTSR